LPSISSRYGKEIAVIFRSQGHLAKVETKQESTKDISRS
jgi:hypothetical protein